MGHNDYDEDMRNEIAQEILEAVENLALMTQREFLAVREELRGDIRAACDEVRTDLKGEIYSMRDDLRGEMKTMRDELRGEMQAMRDELRTEFRAGMQDLRSEMHIGFQGFYAKLHEEIEDLRNETKAGFAAITGVVGNHEYRIKRVEKKLDIS